MLRQSFTALTLLVGVPAWAAPAGAPADTITADLGGTAFTAEKVRVRKSLERVRIKAKAGSVLTEHVEVKVTVPPAGAVDRANLVVTRVKLQGGKADGHGFMPRGSKCALVTDAGQLGSVSCAVHVTQRTPRLVGSFQATLEEAGGTATLAVKGSFDVKAP